MLELTIALAVLAAAAGAAVLIYHARYFIPGKRQQILVTLLHDDKHAIRGVLFARHGGFLILKMAAIVEADGGITRIDGDVVIELAHVGFFQILPHA